MKEILDALVGLPHPRGENYVRDDWQLAIYSTPNTASLHLRDLRAHTDAPWRRQSPRGLRYYRPNKVWEVYSLITPPTINASRLIARDSAEFFFDPFDKEFIYKAIMDLY